MRKWFTALRRWAGPADKQATVANAWRHIQHGNGTVEDFEIVFTDLVDITGYYRRPSYSEWMARTKTPEGFELHSALSNARAEVVQHIMGYLTLDDEALVALERAARNEAGR